MGKRLAMICVLLAMIGLSAGCIGGSKATGKNNNQDKPKPVEEAK